MLVAVNMHVETLARSILEMVQWLREDQTLGLYFDYDLAGLDMQAKYMTRGLACHIELLTPAHSADVLKHHGRHDLHTKQLDALKRLRRYADSFPGLAPHVETINAVKKGLLQEAMLAHSVTLTNVSAL